MEENRRLPVACKVRLIRCQEGIVHTEPDKDRYIQEHIDCRLEGIVHGL